MNLLTFAFSLDPYDESPIKRRGEEYISRADGSPRSLRGSPKPTSIPHNEEYKYQTPALDLSRSPQDLLLANRGVASSPSPLPTGSQQTPPRSFAPEKGSYAQRRAAPVNSNASQSAASSEGSGTPPSTQKTRAALLRARNDTKSRSPLHETHPSGDD